MWKILTRTGFAFLLATAALSPAAAGAGIASGFMPSRPADVERVADRLALEQVIDIARAAGGGDYLNANLVDGTVYRVKIIRPDGVVVFVFVDAATGSVLDIRDR